MEVCFAQRGPSPVNPKGVDYTSFRDAGLESFHDQFVQLLNNNVEIGKEPLKILRQQQENRILFQFVPKYVIKVFPPGWEQRCQLLNVTYDRKASHKTISSSLSHVLGSSSPSTLDGSVNQMTEESIPATDENRDGLGLGFSSPETSRTVSTLRSSSDADEVSAPAETSSKEQDVLETYHSAVGSYQTPPEILDNVGSESRSTIFEEDKEFKYLSVPKVRRSSSLRSSLSSGSLCKKKAVRFADVLGLDLESIRHITLPSEPPDIPEKALKHLKLDSDSNRKLDFPSKPVLQLTPCFSSPGWAPDFTKKVHDRKVCLETFTVDDSHLSVAGSICVTNISYAKDIFVRYTTNGWLSFQDVHATYLAPADAGRIDKFFFKLKLPDSFGFGCQMEFAISYRSANQVFWDNNRKANYRVKCCFKV